MGWRGHKKRGWGDDVPAVSRQMVASAAAAEPLLVTAEVVDVVAQRAKGDFPGVMMTRSRLVVVPPPALRSLVPNRNLSGIFDKSDCGTLEDEEATAF